MSSPYGSISAAHTCVFKMDGVERRVSEPLSVPPYSEICGVTSRGKAIKNAPPLKKGKGLKAGKCQ